MTAAAPAPGYDVRQAAIDACVRRATVAVYSHRPEGDEVSVGRIVAVHAKHLVISITRNSESVLPLGSVVSIEPLRRRSREGA